jgi:hypothetical protein
VEVKNEEGRKGENNSSVHAWVCVRCARTYMRPTVLVVLYKYQKSAKPRPNRRLTLSRTCLPSRSPPPFLVLRERQLERREEKRKLPREA